MEEQRRMMNGEKFDMIVVVLLIKKIRERCINKVDKDASWLKW